ncbi:MAG: PDZ domain-containing protein [Dehalococcoidia bacterium]|nr:MAG: PDZ domain-containing protein [Dehalococcoidia bacterium]
MVSVRPSIIYPRVFVKRAGQEINNSGDLFQALTDHRAGETVTVGFYRDGKLISAEVTLG